MYMIKKDDGVLTKDYSEILNVQHKFYETLYMSDETVKFNVINHSQKGIDEIQRLALEQDISERDLFDAMMTLKDNKCPGSDGLPVEFFRKFHKLTLPLLHRVVCEAMNTRKLNPSGRHGIITLVPKGKKDQLLMKNWRPITLLNCDYKIIAKAIANRLDLVLPDIVGEYQTGFMDGRSIHFNIRKTAEIISFLKSKNELGIIAMIDFEKCFDRVEYRSIKGAMEYFGFGKKFIQMVFLLFMQLEICTTSNGYSSRLFVKGRDINQGCPASPKIYTICGEVMAQMIFKNGNIKGISLYGIEHIPSQFADDTGAYLKYDQIVVEEFLNTLAHVEAQMGLKVSYEKTTLYHIGSLASTDAKIYTTKEVKWSNGPIDMLGTKLGCRGEFVKENYEKIIDKVKKTCAS